MTKEELEKEAEEWVKDHSGLIGSYKFVKYDYDSMQKAYLAGAEPREKHITELQEKLEGAEKARDYWKDSSFDWRHKCTSRKPFKVAVKAQKQLKKAKEHIENLLYYVKQCTCERSNYAEIEKDIKEAEQFLKEE